MPNATYVFEVRWDGVAYTDETARVISLEYKRGRDTASQLTGRSIAGELVVELLNTDGRFSPMNTASALSPNIKPGRRVRLRSTAPVIRTLWFGFLDEIQPRPKLTGLNTAVLRASGPLKWIAQRKATTAIFTTILTGTAVQEVLKDAQWSTTEIRLDTGQTTMNEWKADGDSALHHLREIEETEIGYVGEGSSGEIVFEDIHHRLKSDHLTAQAIFSDAAGATLQYQGIEELDPWREIFNRFEAEVMNFTLQTSGVLWTLAGEQPAVNAASGTLDIWAQYPNPDSPAQASHVRTWDDPTTGDWAANNASGGAGTDLQPNVTVAVTKFANSMRIRFTNNSTQTAYITSFTARGRPVYREDPIKVVNESTASQADFGARTYPLPAKFVPSVARAGILTRYALTRYQDPLPTLSLRFYANESAGLLSQALTRDISDRITVIASSTSPGADLGINTDFFIEAMDHRIDRESQHWVTYELSAASGDGGYFVLGTSLLGQTTKLAP